MARMIPRRRFIQAGAAVAALPAPVFASPATSPPVLRGIDFALDISTIPVNFTGQRRLATVVNAQLPAPILRWREGDTVTLAVTNRLAEPTSIHWHGIRTPSNMDGVPGLSFPGIAPGETFIYRFPVPQSGTYWYHSHSGMQEQLGLYGALIVDPRDGYIQRFDRGYVVLLSDWTDEQPETIVSNLKFQADYYNFGQRTTGDFLADVRRTGLGATVADRLAWGEMRMAPTGILDVSGATYTYLLNGFTPAANWTALFRPGEHVRLRFINASAMSIFDVRIPGLTMTVVQADGNDAQPVPPMDPPPRRTMADMGMGMDHSGHGSHMMPAGSPGLGVAVDNVVAMPMERLDEPGTGLEQAGRRALRYSDLRALRPGEDQRPPGCDIVLRLTGNMHRFIWGFDGRKYSAAEPIHLRLNERVHFVVINDTMMEHPNHLHGLWSELDNGQDAFRPFKHTVLVKPAKRITWLVTADLPGRWAFHCHLLYHMETGMFREVRVS